MVFPVAPPLHGSYHLQVKLMLGHFPCLHSFSGDPVPLGIQWKFLTVIWKAWVTEPHSAVQLHRFASEEAHWVLAVWLSVSEHTKRIPPLLSQGWFLLTLPVQLVSTFFVASPHLFPIKRLANVHIETIKVNVSIRFAPFIIRWSL